MCQMIVASRRITATRAIFDPRRRLIRPIPGPHPRDRAASTCSTNLAEDEAGHGAALFGDRAQPIGRLARVAAAGRQAPVVRQTARPREPLDRADPRGQRQAAVGPAAGNRRQDRPPSRSAPAACRSPTSSCSICSSHSFHCAKSWSISRRSIGPRDTWASHFFALDRVEPLGRTLLLQVVFPQQVLDLVDRPRAELAQPLAAAASVAGLRRPVRWAADTRRMPCTRLPANSRWRLTHRISPRALASRRSVFFFDRFSGWIRIVSRQPYSASSFNSQSLKPQTSRIATNPPSGSARSLQFREERPHPLPFRAHLPFQDHVACFVAKIHGQLLAVLVDSKV